MKKKNKNYIFHFIRVKYKRFDRRLRNREVLSLEKINNDRFKIFCKLNNSKPIPNSIAEKIKKINVNERRFQSFNNNPINNVNAYNVTHNNSAINKSCNKDIPPNKKEESKIKKKTITKLISFNITIYNTYTIEQV